ncbi:MAG TPA: phosphoribosylglycinamide synthetase C domain-containing protein [Rhizomicrobium sp.]|jgi:phosphoribosylamine--glycine ligase
MRFLGIGKDGSLGDMYLALLRAGHEVRTYIEDPLWRGILRGFIHPTDDWKRELKWLGRDGIVIFERADQGELQDELRRDGYNVIGGSAFGDRMENDRSFGQACMRQAGMTTSENHPFTDFDTALDFIVRRPRRYVLKLNGSNHASSANAVGDMDSGEDIAALLRLHKARRATPDFILMDHVSGVEVGVGAYFNGEAFLEPVVMDWEHKRLFPGDLGELTGEMGTLLTYRGCNGLFRQTLAKMAEQLRAGGYIGYININTIVNGDGIWPLEFTCRFGYPGAAICSSLHRQDWGVLFRRMIDRDRLDFPTCVGFAVGVVLTVPPFPVAEDYSEQSKGLPVLFRKAPTEEEWRHLQLSEVEKSGSGLVTTGGLGSLMAVTGVGDTVEQARDAAYQRCSNIVVPGLRYRNDIGLRFLTRDRTLMQQWGYWP